LSDLEVRLGKAAVLQINHLRWEISELKSQLALYSPRTRVLMDRQRLDEMIHNASKTIAHRLQLEVTRMDSLSRHLSALSPIAVLERGYAIVTNQAGELVHSVKQVASDEELRVHVQDGEFDVRVEDNPNGKL
jgi:exodeoxyribonuclease VII large subunit